MWRSRVAFGLKAAALCLAVLLGTPFNLDYDMVVLAPAIAFLALHGFARGFGPYAKSMLAALWIVPLLARPVAGAIFVPLGVPAMLVAFILAARDALSGARAPEPGTGTSAALPESGRVVG